MIFSMRNDKSVLSKRFGHNQPLRGEHLMYGLLLVATWDPLLMVSVAATNISGVFGNCHQLSKSRCDELTMFGSPLWVVVPGMIWWSPAADLLVDVHGITATCSYDDHHGSRSKLRFGF